MGELVNSLRICGKMRSADDYCVAFHDGCCEAEPVCMYELMMKAADAIEELQATVEGYKSSTNMVFVEKDGETVIEFVPRWIPVKERLPEREKKTYWVCTDTGYQCECRWTNNQFGIRVSDEWGWSIFDIPQYQKVAAWMSLPDPYEPPKEESYGV